MNIAIIKHINAEDKEYLFKVPSKEKIAKGTLVKVNTRMGESYGILTRDSFEADGDALDYIRQSLGAGKKGELSTVTAVYGETPVIENVSTFDDVKRGLTAMKASEHTYTVSYSAFPIKFRAERKDNGEMMESPCVYTSSEGRLYLGARDVKAYIDVGTTTENIYNMKAAEGEPIFVEIEPETLEWTVEK